VFLLIVAEAATASALGAALGVGVGYLLGQGAVRLVTQTINDLYFVLSVRGAPLTGLALAKGLLLGVGAGVLAALAPALEASRVEPVAALRPSTFEARSRRLVPWLALGGALLAAAGASALLLAARSLALSFAGLFGIVLGLALVSPAATVGLTRLALPLGALLFGTLGRLAARTVQRAVSRTGVAVAALMVAVSVTIGVTLMIGSFRSTVVNWLELTLRADVYVGGASAGAGAAPTLPPGIIARVAAVPGVASVESVRVVQIASPAGDVQVAVTDAARERDAQLYRTAEGSARDAWARVLAGAVLVSEPFANRRALPPSGGEVVLRTDRGLRAFPVAGIYYDYSTERGTVLMHRAVYERFFDDRGLTSLAVNAAPGARPEDVTDALRAALAGTALHVTPNASLRRTALAIFDRTFAVTQALRLLAVVVAFIGVWSALMALQVERTRELATLVALGLSPPQLWALTLLETGFMGLSAGLLSWPTGALLAAILVDVINVRSFGWSLALRFEPWVFGQALGVSVLAALLAGVYPLLRLQRLSAAAALRQE
jgi:putative ABC transport system permease protein